MSNKEYLDTLVVLGLINKGSYYDTLVKSEVSVKNILDLVIDRSRKGKCIDSVNSRLSRERLVDICGEIAKKLELDKSIKVCYGKLESLLRTIIKYRVLGFEWVVDSLFYDLCIDRKGMNIEKIIDNYRLVKVVGQDRIGGRLDLDNVTYNIVKGCRDGFCLEDFNGNVMIDDIKAIIIKNDSYKIFKINEINMEDLYKLVNKKDYDMAIIGGLDVKKKWRIEGF